LPPGTGGNDEAGISANAAVKVSCNENGNFFLDCMFSKYESQIESSELFVTCCFPAISTPCA